ncbi:MAG: hypothetical protein IBX62_10255 [Coriobacteriia bacterium]|nr:hypothetical protein [Coriobacteriia bacterium]
MALRSRVERQPIPRFGSRRDWPRYAAGMLTEALYVLALAGAALGLAALARMVAR